MDKPRQYRKKPVVITAQQFDQDKKYRLAPEFAAVICAHGEPIGGHFGGWHIDTLEGKMHVSDGDWIIKGVQGEFYPCKPDIFEATYEPV
jgi:hypothetical protein